MANFETSREYPSEEDLRDKVDSLYEELIKSSEVSEALGILDKLPDNLEYHNKEHTLDVINETILFSLAAGEPDRVIKQQAVSAAWHDVGYIEQYDQNEQVAVDLFKGSEAYNTLSENDRQEIIANILDTQLKIENGEPIIEQKHGKYGYLMDADTSNFGRDDFFDKRESVVKELGFSLDDGKVKKEFFNFTLKLLENHTWKTEVARFLRQEKKEENIQKAKKELSKLKSG